MTRPQKAFYVPPHLEAADIKVEQGFALSTESDIADPTTVTDEDFYN